MKNVYKKRIALVAMVLMECGCTPDIRYPQIWFDSSVENFELRLSGVSVEAYDLTELDLNGIHTVYLPVGYSTPSKSYKTTVIHSGPEEQKATILLAKYCSHSPNGSIVPTLPDVHHSTRCYYSRKGDVLKIMVCGELRHSHFSSLSRMQIRLPEHVEVIWDEKLGLSSSGTNPIGLFANSKEPDPAVWQPCSEKPTRLRSLAQ